MIIRVLAGLIPNTQQVTFRQSRSRHRFGFCQGHLVDGKLPLPESGCLRLQPLNGTEDERVGTWGGWRGSLLAETVEKHDLVLRGRAPVGVAGPRLHGAVQRNTYRRLWPPISS